MMNSIDEIQQKRLSSLAQTWEMTPESIVAWLVDELLTALKSGEDESGYFRNLHALTQGMKRDAHWYGADWDRAEGEPVNKLGE